MQACLSSTCWEYWDGCLLVCMWLMLSAGMCHFMYSIHFVLSIRICNKRTNKVTRLLHAADCWRSVFSRWTASCDCESRWICQVLWDFTGWRTTVKLMSDSKVRYCIMAAYLMEPEELNKVKLATLLRFARTSKRLFYNLLLDWGCWLGSVLGSLHPTLKVKISRMINSWQQVGRLTCKTSTCSTLCRFSQVGRLTCKTSTCSTL